MKGDLLEDIEDRGEKGVHIRVKNDTNKYVATYDGIDRIRGWNPIEDLEEEKLFAQGYSKGKPSHGLQHNLGFERVTNKNGGNIYRFSSLFNGQWKTIDLNPNTTVSHLQNRI